MQAWQRAAYLKALGIDVWVPRHAAPAMTAEAAVPAPLPAQAAPAPSPAPPVPPEPIGAPATDTSRRAPEPAMASPAAVPPPVTAPAAIPGVSVAPVVPVDNGQWESLRAEVLSCTRCPLHASRTQGVFGVGSRQAQWLVVGEAPGQEEDLKGEPFVGPAGQLLDQMLRAIGLFRDSNVYIANVLKSRPPGNREPLPAEVAACMPYLERQVALLRPKLMLAVGRVAAQNLLGTDAPLGDLRGRVHPFGELNIPLIVTYHPAYLLRRPAEKRKAWEDLKFAREHFRQLTNGSIDGHRS